MMSRIETGRMHFVLYTPGKTLQPSRGAFV